MIRYETLFIGRSISVYSVGYGCTPVILKLQRQQSAPWLAPSARVSKVAPGMAQRPAAIIFDLDGCLWDPEMYELWGGGAPFSDNGDGTLADKAGVTVRLLGAV